MVKNAPIPRPHGIETKDDAMKMTRVAIVEWFESLSEYDMKRVVCLVLADKTGVPRGRSEESDIEYLNRADGDVLVYIRENVRDTDTWITNPYSTITQMSSRDTKS